MYNGSAGFGWDKNEGKGRIVRKKAGCSVFEIFQAGLSSAAMDVRYHDVDTSPSCMIFRRGG